MKSVALHNLGCKVNSYEIEVMQQNLQKSGYKIVDFNQKSDIYIINTCSVTNMADRKSRQMLHRAKKQNPDAIVVAVGCYVQADAFGIAQDDAIDLLVGNNLKKNIAEILDRFMEEKAGGLEESRADDEGYSVEENQAYAEGHSVGEVQTDVEGHSVEERNFLRKTLNNTTIVDVKKADFEDAQMEQTAEHARAYIKIQDGCNRFCSYCIIPYTRGRVRSRQPESVLQEICGLVKEGYREFVLTGIHISSYGLDFEEKNPKKYLSELIRDINAIEGVERIRIGSFEPMILTDDFVAEIASCDKMCPHFHISLQSGCDATLKRMNRRYTAEEYFGKAELLRKYFPGCAITTDVIVGFPGETEEEFMQTKAFLEKVNFFEMHIFKYSRRKGTKADAMPDQIPEEIKTERSNILLALEQQQSKAYRATFIGRRVKVLLEEEKEIGGKTYWLGHTGEYVKVAVPAGDFIKNMSVVVSVEGFLQEDIMLGRE
ncbi:MAG: tRNA (N(6)-L-threonylcarbamoyladenosine(37)-C(2))-methylthiotransferase MtaB [Lachnospiraceae bacterium]|nr:tRNA (N(6)-L-threonylcarbamoyladenosine(37)-C(2))-methylthiotransferase MtaB [Lachnospiraceae bacterium]